MQLILNERDGFAWDRPAQLNDPTLSGTLEDEYESGTITFSAQWHREGAADAARLFRLWAGSSLGRMEAERRGLTLISLAAIRDVDFLISEEWEDSVELEFQIGIVSTARMEAGLVDTADVDIHLNG